MKLPKLDGCPACLEGGLTEIGKKYDYLIFECRHCKTILAEILPEKETSADAIQDFYDHYYDAANFTLNPATEQSLQKVVNSFCDYRQTGRLLDIGFGEGGLLGIAEKHGWECYGTEISPPALQYGAERGWKVCRDASKDEHFPPNGFDVVTMVELIEHIPNPDDILRTASSLVRPNGLLYLTTPNRQSINWRCLGTKWSIVHPPEHIIIWSPIGIEKALKRNGFTIKKTRTEGFNPVEILAHLRAKNNEPISANRNEAAFALNETFMSSPWRRALKTTINRGLSLFRLGDGIKVWAEKSGAE